MKKFNYFLLFTLLTLFSVNLRAQNEPFRTNVYEMNYDGSKYYRIPALVTAPDGTLVAVADKRGNELGDLPNDISIVCRRSSDNGNTWDAPILIAQGKGKEKGYGDPLVIVDKEENKLVCIFAGGNGLWPSNINNRITINQSESYDNGLNWSEPKEITQSVYLPSWYGAFAGSGHGLQLKDGRLMFAVSARLTSNWGGTLTNYAVYSDDHGKTWKVSEPVEGSGDESKVVELENGDVMMSIRNRDGGFRKFAISKDRGETWEKPTFNTDLRDPACNGDIIRYSTSAEGQSILLQSLPNSDIREKVTVYASFDEGKSWKVSKLISAGYSAYSSMTVLENGEIGILVENGKWDSKLPGEDGFVLEFVRFTKEWLIGDSEGEGGEELPEGVLSCNGTDRYMSIPASANLYPATGGQFTVTAKVKVPAYISGSNMRFLSSRSYEGTDNNGTVGYEFFGGNSASESFSVNLSLNGKPWSAGHKYASAYYGLKEGVWAHLSWTFDGAAQQSKIYVDGVLVDQKSIPEYASKSWENTRDVLVGAGYSNNNGAESVPTYFATAEIDDVRFYSKALTADELITDKTSTVGPETANLLAAYDFAAIEGNTVPDISGNGHNGTLVNFPSKTVKHTVNITTPADNEGTLRVLNGTKEVPNGFKVAEGTTLTVEAVATEKYNLESINVNGIAIEGTTFVLNEDVTVSATFSKKDPSALEYEIPSESDNKRSSGDRLIKDITFTGAAEPFTVEVTNTTEVYLDRTDLTMNAAAGDEINTSWTFRKDIYWMSYYIYIDYNHDGKFDETTELVSFTHFNPDPDNGGKWTDSKGNENSGPGDRTYSAPSFIIPEDIASVNTRVRFKCDWNSKNPCGNTEQSIGSNKGTIVDFNINIEGAKVIEYSIPEFSGENHWQNEAYVKTITVGDQVYNDAITNRQFYNNTGLKVNAFPGETVTAHYEANNLGEYSESIVRQDLRFDIAVMFIDWDHDGIFEVCEKVAGNATPKHNVGGNYDVLDIVKNIEVPATATPGIARVRMSYVNAWDEPAKAGQYEGYADKAPSGIVYDFDILVKEGSAPQKHFYTLTIEKDALIPSVTIIDLDKDVLVNSGDEVEEGTNLTIAVDKGRYTIDCVLVNGEALELNADDEGTFVMTADTKVQVFAKYCNINYPTSIKGGSLMVLNLSEDGAVVDANNKVPYGSTVSILPMPEEEIGYYLTEFLINDVDKMNELDESGSYCAEITEDWNIRASFKQDIIEFAVGDEYGEKTEGAIEVTTADGETVNSGDPVFQGETLTVKLIPNEGYEVEQFTVTVEDGEAQVIDPKEYAKNEYALTIEASYYMLNATFKKGVGIDNNLADAIVYDADAQTLTIPAEATAEVFDIAGNKIMNIVEATTSVRGLAEGCYIVRVANAESVKTIKFIKK